MEERRHGSQGFGPDDTLPPEIDRQELQGKLQDLRGEIDADLGSMFKNDNDHCFAFAIGAVDWDARFPTIHLSREFKDMRLTESLVRRTQEFDPKGTLYYFCLEFDGRGEDEGMIEFYLKEDSCETRTSVQKGNMYKETRSGYRQTDDIGDGLRLQNIRDLAKFNKACFESLN